MENKVMLTTIDNPFNPFNDWDNWYKYDTDHGYNTSELLDKFSYTSDALPDEVNDESINTAIDEIVRDDPLGRYIKIRPNDRILVVKDVGEGD